MLNAACSKRRATPLAAAVEKPDFRKTKLGRGVPSLNGIGERDRGSQRPSSNRARQPSGRKLRLPANALVT